MKPLSLISIISLVAFFCAGPFVSEEEAQATPEQQVQIEAQIVETQQNLNQELGTNFGFNHNQHFNQFDQFQPNELNTIETDFGNVQAEGLNLDAITGGPASDPFGGFGDVNDVGLEAALNAAEREGQGDILSSPRVITANQQEAQIQSGTQIPFIEPAALPLDQVEMQLAPFGGIQLQITPQVIPGNQIQMDVNSTIFNVNPTITIPFTDVNVPAPTVEFRNATLQLNVIPQITPDDRIIMELQVENVIPDTQTGPQFDTRQITTQVLVNQGQTLMMGGLLREDITTTEDRVPILGDIPAVGRLFRSDGERNDREGLLIFVTPRILRDPGA